MLNRHISGIFVVFAILFGASQVFAQEQTVDDKTAREAFAEKFIWSYALLGVDPAQEADLTGMYQGTYKEWLSPQEFYQEIGRPDLVESLETNESGMLIGGLIMYTGMLGTAAGATWLTVEGLGGDDPNYLLPALVTGASVALLIGGLIYKPATLQPITQREAWKLADQYNQQLKDELGLPEDYSPVPTPKSSLPAEVRYGLSPTLGGVSGGFRVAF